MDFASDKCIPVGGVDILNLVRAIGWISSEVDILFDVVRLGQDAVRGHNCGDGIAGVYLLGDFSTMVRVPEWLT